MGTNDADPVFQLKGIASEKIGVRGRPDGGRDQNTQPCSRRSRPGVGVIVAGFCWNVDIAHSDGVRKRNVTLLGVNAADVATERVGTVKISEMKFTTRQRPCWRRCYCRRA